jgi:hypothetical protein
VTASIDQLGEVKPKNRAATQIVLDAARAAGHELNQVFGVGGGDHSTGLATDFMVYNDRAAGDWIADYVWANRERLGVRWVIWRQRIKSINPRGVYGPPNQWNPMEDRGNGTQNHMDHVHVMWDSSAVTGEALSKPVTLPKPPSAVKPTVKPAPTSGSRPWLIASQKGVYPDLLRPGVNASTSVYLYQLALRRYLNVYANKYNPSGATGNYGSETATMTGRVYLDLAKKNPRAGWLTPAQVQGKAALPTWPGPALLKALGLANLGHS